MEQYIFISVTPKDHPEANSKVLLEVDVGNLRVSFPLFYIPFKEKERKPTLAPIAAAQEVFHLIPNSSKRDYSAKQDDV